MKEEILNLLNMQDICIKYGIKNNRYMCNCPFHKDKTPSMKIYNKTFYCFSCNKTGDLIQFVQYLFNLDFSQAMQKINIDFGLNLQAKGRITKKELEEIKLKCEIRRQQKEQQKQIINQKLIHACNRYLIYSKILKNIKKNTNINNWEDYVLTEIFLEKKLEEFDIYMDNLIKIKEDK